ncbi:MAG: hypothetical protein ACI36V_02820 [Coriobacteriales bacterium]
MKAMTGESREKLPRDEELALFRIAALRPTIMTHEQLEASTVHMSLLEAGYLTRERFGLVSMLNASIKGLHYCSDHFEEMDKDALGFQPLF